MRIAAITMIKNEADVVETFVRYHLQFVDLLIVVNHRSVDCSPEIVRKLRSEGLPVELQEEMQTGHVQSSVMTRLMRECVERHGADWILPLDGDEFLVPTDAKGDIRDILKTASSSMTLRIPWRTYIPTSEDDPDECVVLKRIQNRLAQEGKQRFKVIVPAALAARPDLALRQGNHGLISIPTGARIKEVADSSQLALAHFPVRSPNQIMVKAFGGWLSALTRPGRKENEALHWKALFDRFKSGEGLTREELTDIAINYLAEAGTGDVAQLVRDPVGAPKEEIRLCYSDERAGRPYSILAQTAEEIVAELMLGNQTCREAPKKRKWFHLFS